MKSLTAAPLPPPPPPKQPISREGWTAFLTAASIAVGIWAAIILLPELTSLLPLTLIVGPGIIFGYMRKDIRSVSWGLAVASMGYFGIRVLYLRDVINDALLFDSLKTVVPIAVLGTLACAWLGRVELSPDGKTLTAFTKLGFYSLLIITPFIIGGLHDYNERADTSSPYQITLTIVDMWVDSDSDAWITVESSDGMSFSFSPTWDFYREHDIGDSMDVLVRRGALGYPWFVWERPAVIWLQENALFVGFVIVGVMALVYYYNSKAKARKQAYTAIQEARDKK